MFTDARQPDSGLTATAAWQQAVAEAEDKPWLAALLARQGARVFRRFIYFYHRLGARPGQIRRLQQRLGVGLAGAALLLALGGSPTAATPGAAIVVDGTVCTLAAAITAANTDTATGGCPAGSGADVIDLRVDVNLTSALPDFASAITLEGNGHTIQRTGGAEFPVLRSDSTASNLTLNDATISGGAPNVTNGGGSKLTLNNATLTGSSLGLYNVTPGTATVRDSTIAGNTGTGIWNYYGTLTVINSTIAGNAGTGIFNAGGGAALTVQNSTISGNATGGTGFGIVNGNGMTVVSNSIVAHQPSGKDCGGGVEILSDGSNLESGVSCGFTMPSDRQNVSAEQLKLGPLANNGGPTLTMALLPGSVAIDRIPSGTNGCGGAVNIDQRGQPRPADGDADDVAACDSGAYEMQPALQLDEVLWMPRVLHKK